MVMFVTKALIYPVTSELLTDIPGVAQDNPTHVIVHEFGCYVLFSDHTYMLWNNAAAVTTTINRNIINYGIRGEIAQTWVSDVLTVADFAQPGDRVEFRKIRYRSGV